MSHTPRAAGPRIIPAGAGHLELAVLALLSLEGSSPQVRGIFARPLPSDIAPGIIPAGAGHLGLFGR